MRPPIWAVVGLCVAAIMGCGDDGSADRSNGSVEPTSSEVVAVRTTPGPGAAPEAAPTEAVEVEVAARTTERPWSNPDGYNTPRAAAEGFMRWAEQTRIGGLRPWVIEHVESEPPPEYPDTNRGVMVRFTEWAFNPTVFEGEDTLDTPRPAMLIDVVRPQPSGPWFVNGADASTLVRHVVRRGSDIEIDYFNAHGADGFEYQLYASGSEEPVLVARFPGSGVFAEGIFETVIDTGRCAAETGGLPLSGALSVGECRLPPEPDADLTLVFVSEFGVEAPL